MRTITLAVAGIAAFSMISVSVAAAPKPPAERRPDLGDTLEGVYRGDVISDSQGSSRSDVTLTVTRTGVNRVRIDSSYPRLPVITVTVERAMDKILTASGDSTFLYDPAQAPPHLDVSFHNEVSWSGSRAGALPQR